MDHGNQTSIRSGNGGLDAPLKWRLVYMKIALVTYSLNVGGVESLLQDLGSKFRAAGNEVFFVETEYKGEWSEVTRKLGFPVISVVRRCGGTRARHCAEVALALSDFDVLLINDAPLAMAALRALPPSVVAIPILHMARDSMLRNATSATGQCQRIVAVAPGAFDGLRASLPRSNLRTLCIPNGTSVQPPRVRSVVREGPLRLIYVGRVEHRQKNVLLIPEILGLVIKRGVKLMLDVVGDGPDTAILKDRLVRCGVPYAMHGHVLREQAISLMRRSDILLMPSNYEGLSMTLLEGMAAGLAPVVSRLAGSTDVVVKSGVNGVLVDALDVAACGDAIFELATHPTLLAEIAQGAQETIRTRFSGDLMARDYLSMIGECIQEIRTSPPRRTGEVDSSLLGDFAHVPYGLVRPVRKALRLLGLYSSGTNSQNAQNL